MQRVLSAVGADTAPAAGTAQRATAAVTAGPGGDIGIGRNYLATLQRKSVLLVDSTETAPRGIGLERYAARCL